MEKPVSVKYVDLGVIDGLQTFEVINTETGHAIGYRQTVVEETVIVDPVKDSAVAKLQKLGLTVEEVQALIGA
jgi:hypothetical protein